MNPRFYVTDERALTTLAASQGGYFTSKQAAAIGYTAPKRNYHVHVGNWIRERRGIFRLSTQPLPPRPDLILWRLWSRNRHEGPQGVASSCGDRFVRNLFASGDVWRTHSNFARYLEDMLLQSARLRRVPLEETLELFLYQVKGTPLRWFLYGSGALAVRSIDVQPGDLDFCVNDTGLAGRIFEDLLVEPVTTMTGWIANCGARAFAGCLFEWMAGVHPEVDEPTPHEQGLVALGCLESVRWRDRIISVPPLALQLSVTERRGLSERAALTQAYIESVVERDRPLSLNTGNRLTDVA